MGEVRGCFGSPGRVWVGGGLRYGRGSIKSTMMDLIWPPKGIHHVRCRLEKKLGFRVFPPALVYTFYAGKTTSSRIHQELAQGLVYMLFVFLRGKTTIHVYTSDFWKNCVSVYATVLFHRGAVGPCNWDRLGPMTGTGDWDRRLGPTTGTDGWGHRRSGSGHSHSSLGPQRRGSDHSHSTLGPQAKWEWPLPLDFGATTKWE
jgi:hypothetical protein